MELFLTIALGAAIAGFVQGLSGFGYGLTAMALWAWTLEPKLAAVLALFGGLSGQVFSAFTVRRGWHWPTLLPFVLGGVAGLPLGLWLLPRLDVPTFKAVLGAVLVVVCPLMFIANRLPPIRRGGHGADALAGGIGGIMAAFGGASGVVPTLWCTLRRFDKDRQRAVIQNFNLTMLTVTFVGYLATGVIEPHMWPWMAIVSPAALIPGRLGAKLYLGISELAFRQVVLGLLTFSGVALLVSAAPVLLAR